MKENHIQTGHLKKVEYLHLETQEWKSSLRFMMDEIIFLGHLLDSYVFEPNTPNLFERLQEYRKNLNKIKEASTRVSVKINVHDNNLGGIMECKDKSCDSAYYSNHDVLKASVAELLLNFQNFKLEVFNYAGGILKKRKPNEG